MTIIYLLAKESRVHERFRQLYPVLASKIERNQTKYQLLETTQIVLDQLALNSIGRRQQDVVSDEWYFRRLDDRDALSVCVEAGPPSSANHLLVASSGKPRLPHVWWPKYDLK